MTAQIGTVFDRLWVEIEANYQQLCQSEKHEIQLFRDNLRLLATKIDALWASESFATVNSVSNEEPHTLSRGEDIDYQPPSVEDVSTANATPTTPNDPALHTRHSQKESTHIVNAASDLQPPSPGIAESQEVQSPSEKMNTLQKISEPDLDAHRRHVGSSADILGRSSDPNQPVHLLDEHGLLDSAPFSQLRTPASVNHPETNGTHDISLKVQNENHVNQEDSRANNFSILTGEKFEKPGSEPYIDQPSEQTLETRRTLRPRSLPNNSGADSDLQRKRKSPDSTKTPDCIKNPKPKKQKKKAPSLKSDTLEKLARLPQTIIEPAELYQRLKDQCKSEKDEKLETTTRLFYAIARPEAFYQLKDACSALMTFVEFGNPDLSKTAAATMRALDKLDTVASANAILRRGYLARLVQHSNQKKKEASAEKRSGRIQPESRGHGKTSTLVLTSLMTEAYPYLHQDATGTEYKRKLDCLKSRLSAARNWERLQEKFPGIVALVPVGGYFGIHNYEIERLPLALFEVFVKVLEELRGDFLREVGKPVSNRIQEILQQRNLSRRRIFENMDNDALEDVQFDSDEIIQACNEVVPSSSI